MQRTSKHLSVFAIVACVVAVLAFGGTAAFAAGAWPPEGGNTLTVNATASEDESFKADVIAANVTVDVYKIAEAEAQESYQTFKYTLLDQFVGEGESASISVPEGSEDANAYWKDLASSAAKKLIKPTSDNSADWSRPVWSGPIDAEGKAVTDALGNGLYLVLAHGGELTYGEEIESSLVAASPTYEYAFAPTIVALPSKLADPNVLPHNDGSPVIRTDDSYGEWLNTVEINLKPERGPLYGSLRIVKHIDGFEGEPATFVFRIQSVDDLGNPDGKYDNYASVYYTGGESVGETVTHIKAGTKVLVTEEYEGARFKYVSGNGIVGPIVADAWLKSGENRAMVQIDFTNEPTNITTGGHGIQNTTTMIPKGNDDSWNGWDWSDWVGAPAEEVVDPPSEEE